MDNYVDPEIQDTMRETTELRQSIIAERQESVRLRQEMLDMTRSAAAAAGIEQDRGMALEAEAERLVQAQIAEARQQLVSEYEAVPCRRCCACGAGRTTDGGSAE